MPSYAVKRFDTGIHMATQDQGQSKRSHTQSHPTNFIRIRMQSKYQHVGSTDIIFAAFSLFGQCRVFAVINNSLCYRLDIALLQQSTIQHSLKHCSHIELFIRIKTGPPPAIPRYHKVASRFGDRSCTHSWSLIPSSTFLYFPWIIPIPHDGRAFRLDLFCPLFFYQSL